MGAKNVGGAVLEMNAIDNTLKVLRDIKGGVQSLRDEYDKLGRTLKQLAEAFGIAMLTRWIDASVEAMNHLRELSLATGVTVETLSALRKVAKESGTDLDGVATIVQKLSKNMFEFAETGKGKASQAFERLGYTQEQVRDGMKDMNTFLPEFARKLLETGNATEQVAMAQQLLGKGGAQLLPFLHALAEQGELVAKVTTEQAEQAHIYAKAIAEIESRGTSMRNQFATNVLPSLLATVKAFGDLTAKKNDLSQFFQAVGTVIRWAAAIVGSFVIALQDMGDAIAARAAQIAALARLDFKGAGQIGDERAANYARNAAAQQELWNRLTGTPPEIEVKPRGGRPLGGAGGGAGDASFVWTPQMEEMFQARKAAWIESDKITADQAKTLADLVKAGEKYQEQIEKRTQTVLDSIEPSRLYTRELAQMQELVDAGKISQEQADAAMRKWVESHTKVVELGKAADVAAQAGERIGLSFTSALDKLVFDAGRGITALGLLRAMAVDVAKVIFARNVSDPLAGLIGAGFKSAFSSSASSIGAGGIGTGMTTGAEVGPWLASGGVFSGGRLTAFANGGIVGGPTIFPMANGMGLMGEAGPEAVMPLRRTASGDLGVIAHGGGGSTTVYIDATGADQAAIARLEAKFNLLGASVERRAVGGMRKEAARRGVRMPF